MIELRDDQLVFRFPEVHSRAALSIDFQRTLRIPDDGTAHFLPPGLGQFPLHHVDDYRETTPAEWAAHGGVFFPMHQAEATWLSFDGGYPMAVKVGAGKINAVTGRQWRNKLAKLQDYLVAPDQPWLDGFNVRKGMIRQFVAMPLGEGYTAEEQLTGKAQHGGIQLAVYPMKAAVYEELQRRKPRIHEGGINFAMAAPQSEMGLAPGGLMRQEIYEDDYGIDAWETEAYSRCFVHILNSVAFFHVTGQSPPQQSPTAWEYTEAGLPWFDYFDAELTALEGAKELAKLESVGAKQGRRGGRPTPLDLPVREALVRKTGRDRVREGAFAMLPTCG